MGEYEPYSILYDKEIFPESHTDEVGCGCEECRERYGTLKEIIVPTPVHETVSNPNDPDMLDEPSVKYTKLSLREYIVIDHRSMTVQVTFKYEE